VPALLVDVTEKVCGPAPIPVIVAGLVHPSGVPPSSLQANVAGLSVE
jgi:hypothetical protein